MLIVLGMATIFGAIKGFAWQVASLASIIVSYFVAYNFRLQVADMIQAAPPWNQFLAMLILYVGTSFVIWVGFRLFSSAIDRVRLREFDRHLGAGFGLAKGAVFCLLITMFAMSLLGPSQQTAICESRSGYYISYVLDRSIGILPKEIHDVVGPYLDGLDDKLNNHTGHDHTVDGSEDGAEAAWPINLDNLSLNSLPAIPEELRNALPPIGLPNLPGNVQPASAQIGVGPNGQGGYGNPETGRPTPNYPSQNSNATFPPQNFPPLGSQPGSESGANFAAPPAASYPPANGMRVVPAGF
ncbi:CvpA family protein [Aureliella helgolandensis]|nr:CvpA family protein [Aureliella helgolandensis]